MCICTVNTEESLRKILLFFLILSNSASSTGLYLDVSVLPQNCCLLMSLGLCYYRRVSQFLHGQRVHIFFYTSGLRLACVDACLISGDLSTICCCL